MNTYKKFFYESKKFFLLRTTGWLIGLAVAILFALFWRPAVALYSGIVTSILMDFYLFKFKGLKESHFKNPEVMQKMMSFPLNFDKYASVMTWMKPIILGVITWFIMTCDIKTTDFVVGALLGSSLLYPIIISIVVSQRVAVLCKVIRADELTPITMPPNYGMPGYDCQGTFTGSPTAIGGCSN